MMPLLPTILPKPCKNTSDVERVKSVKRVKCAKDTVPHSSPNHQQKRHIATLTSCWHSDKDQTNAKITACVYY